jgi:hypothetical protein
LGRAVRPDAFSTKEWNPDNKRGGVRLGILEGAGAHLSRSIRRDQERRQSNSVAQNGPRGAENRADGDFCTFPGVGNAPAGDIESLTAMRYVVPTRTAFVETKAHLLF